MFAHAYFASAYFAPVYFSPVAAASSSGSRGRRLARWVIPAPSIASPVGEWIRERENEEILYL